MDIPKGEMLLERLREYVQEQGELHCFLPQMQLL